MGSASFAESQTSSTDVVNPGSNNKAESTDVEQLNINQMVEEKEYVFPPMKLLTVPKAGQAEDR